MGQFGRFQGTLSGGGGGSGIGSSLFGSLAASGGNPLLATGLFAGGQLFGGLAGLIGGAGQRRRQRGIFNDLGNFSSQLDNFQGRLNPQNLFSQSLAASRPEFNRVGRQLDERFGFDSGRAGGELSRLLSEHLGSLMPQLQRQSAEFDFLTKLKAAGVKAQQGQFV